VVLIVSFSYFTSLQYDALVMTLERENSSFCVSKDRDNNKNQMTLTDYDSFLLLINEPLIDYNASHLSISNLTITFANGTDISQGDAEDNVTIEIINNANFSESYSVTYNNVSHCWETVIYVYYFSPRRYFVNLTVTTENYYYNNTIFSYKVPFSIVFGYNSLIINSENNTLSNYCSISTDPHDLRDYILLLNSEVCANILNSTNDIVKTLVLEQTGFIGFYYTWSSGKINITNFSVGQYYSLVIVDYDEEIYVSEPSNTELYEKDEIVINSFEIIWIIFPISVMIVLHLLKKEKNNKKYNSD